jgi:predicted methyltransferase
VRLAQLAWIAAVASACGGPVAAVPAPHTPAPVTAPAPAAIVDAPLGRPTSEAYTGDLSIFEEPGRAEALQIDRVMEVLGVRPGVAVADVGAGSGWFSVRAARMVGESGVVYAIEINREYVSHIEERAKREGLSNIKVILGKTDDPLLEPRSVDVVLLLKTYHELHEPLALMRKLRTAMRPGGTLGVIDRNGRGDDHGIDADTVVREVDRVGFDLVARHDFVRSERVDYFLVFRPRPDAH